MLNTDDKKDPRIEFAKSIEKVVIFVVGFFKELYLGVRHGLIPWGLCGIFSILGNIGYAAHVDRSLFRLLHLGKIYPTKPLWVLLNWAIWAFSGFWAWALFQMGFKQYRTRELHRVFSEAGLKSSTGRLPTLVFEKTFDELTQMLRVTIAGNTLEKFKAARAGIESNMGIFIDDFRENRKRGTIDIIFSKNPMPRNVELANVALLPPCKFLVGETRASIIKADIRRVPHLLIAGQTGGGKSSFLRQFITTHLLNCKNSQFILIDLKEGLESHLFEGIPDVAVYENVESACKRLGEYSGELPRRLNAIKEANCLDFDSFCARPGHDPETDPKREFIVVDEAAELFLSSDRTKVSEAQQARRVLSDIARRGRAAGVHLIISTQRPDSRSLDPQVKANLPGVLCFQMANDASSIAVLGNGRGTELPPYPGRGIWKVGAEMLELQTPFLSHDAAVSLLAPLKKSSQQSDQADQPEQKVQ